MALKKLVKWEIALIAIVILIIPFVVVYQLTKADIELQINPSFASGCNDGGTVCTYNMDSTAKVIILNEDEESWRVTGNCIDTEFDSQIRQQAVAKRDGLEIDLTPVPSNNPCRDLVIFKKIDWNRENKIITQDVQVQCITTPCDPIPTDFEINIFTLKDIAKEKDISKFIEQSYGG